MYSSCKVIACSYSIDHAVIPLTMQGGVTNGCKLTEEEAINITGSLQVDTYTIL